MNKVFFAISFLFALGCATGEKFRDIDIGMERGSVLNILGGADKVLTLQNGYIANIYEDRLVSGWGWDKADYFVVFNKDGRVVESGHGPVTCNNCRANSELAIGISEALSGPKRTECTSTKDYFGNVHTTCRGD